MAKLTSRIFKFTPSSSPDVVAYKIYVDLPGAASYTSPFSMVNDPVVDAGDGKIHADLANLVVASSKDGVYDIGVTALDEVSNESDMAVLANANLDCIAPDAPTDLEIA